MTGEPTQKVSSIDRPVAVGDAVGVAVGTAVAIVAAFIASFLGRFLSYGGTGTSLSASSFSVTMGIAVFGPFVLVALAAVISLIRLSQRRLAWPFPLIAVFLMPVAFMVCATVIGS